MTIAACFCGSGKPFAQCCGRFMETVEGVEAAPTAEALMRSRYSAYVLRHEVYLLSTWHKSTRPASLQLDHAAATQWLGLDVKRHVVNAADDDSAIVEFVARFKIGGRLGKRAERMHEVSHFIREHGRWFYVDGEHP